MKRYRLHVLLLFASAAFFLCSGCSPKIIMNIQQSYPARVEGSPVMVYELIDTPPEAAELLGDIRIKDSGFSTGCNYEKVMGMAKEQTNLIGGNSLHLTWHDKPSAFGSSCHQIEANILLVPDSVYMVDYYDSIATRYNGSLTDGSAAGRPRRNPNGYFPDRATSRHSLIINAGYAFITSKMESLVGSADDLKQGLDINAAYQWTSRSGIGFGFHYSGYFASTSVDYANKIKLGLHYIAPEFVIRQDINHKWTFRESLGFGYARYTESLGGISAGVGGIGYHVDLGMEYRLSPSVGIGASIGMYGTRFSSLDKAMREYGSDDKAGITRISLNGGLRFYF